MDVLAPEAPYAGAEWVELEDLHFAVIRHSGVRLEDLRVLFDAGFPALGQAIEIGSFVPAGPGLAIYQGDPAAGFDLYIGFPVAQPLSAPVEVNGLRVEGLSIPAGDAAAASHFGSYEGLGEAWGKLMGFVVAGGRVLRDGLMIEAYVSMSGAGESAVGGRTDLYALV